jgi:hypothetical protein
MERCGRDGIIWSITISGLPDVGPLLLLLVRTAEHNRLLSLPERNVQLQRLSDL